MAVVMKSIRTWPLVSLVLLLVGCGQGVDEPCDGDGMRCADGLFCDYPDDGCGTTGVTGVCVVRPSRCEPSGSFLECGCDGARYDDACSANHAGQDLRRDNVCHLLDHEFACGPSICNSELFHVCRRRFSASAAEADIFSCEISVCDNGAPGNCDCLKNTSCGGNCVEESGNVTLTCEPN
jgi:hypothetical protein